MSSGQLAQAVSQWVASSSCAQLGTAQPQLVLFQFILFHFIFQFMFCFIVWKSYQLQIPQYNKQCSTEILVCVGVFWISCVHKCHIMFSTMCPLYVDDPPQLVYMISGSKQPQLRAKEYKYYTEQSFSVYGHGQAGFTPSIISKVARKYHHNSNQASGQLYFRQHKLSQSFKTILNYL